MFITKKKHNRLLKEERGMGIALGYQLGYKLGQVEQGNKGFITGRDDLFQDIKEYLERRV